MRGRAQVQAPKVLGQKVHRRHTLLLYDVVEGGCGLVGVETS